MFCAGEYSDAQQSSMSDEPSTDDDCMKGSHIPDDLSIQPSSVEGSFRTIKTLIRYIVIIAATDDDSSATDGPSSEDIEHGNITYHLIIIIII